MVPPKPESVNEKDKKLTERDISYDGASEFEAYSRFLNTNSTSSKNNNISSKMFKPKPVLINHKSLISDSSEREGTLSEIDESIEKDSMVQWLGVRIIS